jgi:hypothetical protein
LYSGVPPDATTTDVDLSLHRSRLHDLPRRHLAAVTHDGPLSDVAQLGRGSPLHRHGGIAFTPALKIHLELESAEADELFVTQPAPRKWYGAIAIRAFIQHHYSYKRHLPGDIPSRLSAIRNPQ